jgi:hypothetical protein
MKSGRIRTGSCCQSYGLSVRPQGATTEVPVLPSTLVHQLLFRQQRRHTDGDGSALQDRDQAAFGACVVHEASHSDRAPALCFFSLYLPRQSSCSTSASGRAGASGRAAWLRQARLHRLHELCRSPRERASSSGPSSSSMTTSTSPRRATRRTGRMRKRRRGLARRQACWPLHLHTSKKRLAGQAKKASSVTGSSSALAGHIKNPTAR